MNQIARYIMIGGFLGAGKTTAVALLARHLTDQGKRVGLICNDQSLGLVDTSILRSKGFDVEEVTGGCFCCKFNSLMEAAENLTRESAPDYFLAEPVGSCTDLVATVSYPLRRIYGERFRVAPFSIMVDPMRAARALGLDTSRSFSEKVVYVYLKQLEEADIIAINKCDAYDTAMLDELEETMREKFPRAAVVRISAKDGTGAEGWFRTILEEGDARERSESLDIDYDIYAEGEALLGWLNCTVRLESDGLFDGNQTLLWLGETIRNRMVEKQAEIAHLKMTLSSKDADEMLSVVSLVAGEAEPDLRESLLDELSGGELVINMRAEAPSGLLAEVVHQCLGKLDGIRATVEHMDHLQPSRPIPTHRIVL